MKKDIQYTLLTRTWGIHFLPQDDPILLCIATGDSSRGICEGDTYQIYVSNSVPIDNVREVLVHEITHAFLLMMIHERKGESYDNEFICDFVAQFGKVITNSADDIMSHYYASEKL